MGAKYGSILIKTDQVALVRSALAKVAQEHKRKFLCGPSIHGWMSVFPDDGGLGDVADVIAAALGMDIFQLMVYDSDFFAYAFYRGGKVLDEYNSCPDYFNECSAEERERARGRPELYADLLHSPDDLSRLKAILAAPRYAMEEERLRKFSAVLELENAVGSYEYLLDGERDDIEGWKEFVQIPDEKEAKRRVATLLKAEKKRLEKEGVLLAELMPPGRKSEAVHAWYHSCADPVNGGFLVYWKSHAGGSLWSFNPLRSNKAVDTGLKINDFICSFEISPSGKWLALSHGNLEIWDWPRKTIVYKTEIASRAAHLSFSQDERHLIIADSAEILVISLENGEIVHKFEMGSGGRSCAALHPSGNHLVAINMRHFCMVDIRAKPVQKSLECKTPRSREVPPGPEGDEFILNLQKVLARQHKLDPNSPTDKLIMESSITGRTFTTLHTEGMMKYRFNPQGDLLFCATESGLRVYRWDELLAANKVIPKPVFFAAKPTNGDPTGGYAQDLFLDESRNQVVFCGCFGKICYLKLDSGKSGILLDPPEDIWIVDMALASDGIALSCTCTPNFEERNRGVSKLQFWNYPALCKKAGLE